MLKTYLDVHNILIQLGTYPLSHIEFWGVISGLIAVYMSSRENIWSWILGLLNVVLCFYFFYQIRLYPDMLLQVFFFITNIIGFYLWKFPPNVQANNKNELKISVLTMYQRIWICGICVMGTLFLGSFASKIHLWLPYIFSEPGSYPYADSFTSILSVAATFMLMKKKVEAWWVWLLTDSILVLIYFLKGAYFFSLEYFVFCIIAIYGIYQWNKIFKSYHHNIA